MMGMNNIYWGDRGRCPICQKFVGNIIACVGDEYSDVGIINVKGTCKKHGRVDITNQEWSYEDFVNEEGK